MLHAVVAAGADAAYLGMGELNARRSADNFDEVTFAEACDYAHLRGARLYVAMNTIVLPEEMPRAVKLARQCLSSGADAFIVQDLGLAVALARQLPDARLHASTQMSIHSKDGISALADLGFARVTLARELSLGEIESLCDHAAGLGLEVETFAHGALCVCYSGQCLMSSMIGGRSANRGLCAQACRLPYRLVDLRDEQRQLKSPGEHLLSPKDLCLVENVGDLARAGVASLKIEGRMKSPEYAGTVVAVYREAVDALASDAGIGAAARNDYDSRLGSVFSRGFTSAYFDGMRGNDVMSYQRPNNRGQFVGRVKEIGEDFVELSCEKPLAEGDLLEAWTRHGNFTFKAQDAVKVSGKTVRLPLSAGSSTKFGKRSGDAAAIRPNDRVFRVRSAEAAYADDVREPRIPVSGSVTLRIGKPLRAEFHLADDGSAVATRLLAKLSGDAPAAEVLRDVVEEARTRPVTAEDVASHIDRLGQTPYRLVDLQVELDEGVGIGFSALHHIRNDALEALTTSILESGLRSKAPEGDASRAWLRTAKSVGSIVPPISCPAESRFEASPSEAVPTPPRGEQGDEEACSPGDADFHIAVIAANPECARAAKRAGADEVIVPALNYRRGQAQQEGMLAGDPSPSPFPKKCTIWVPAIDHDPVGESREALLDADAWANVSEGHSVLVESLGALHRALQEGCEVEIGPGLPMVNCDSLRLAKAFEATRVWLSPELNLRQIAELASCADAPRLGIKVAGAQELMVTEHCLLMSQGECAQNCGECKRRRVPFALEDRKGYMFLVASDALGRSHLYNSVALDNVASVPDLVQAGVTGFMVDATLMSPEQCAQATGRLAKALQVWADDGNALTKLPGTTTGHLHRGVK